MRTLVAAAAALTTSTIFLVNRSDDATRVEKKRSQAQLMEAKGKEGVNQFNKEYIILVPSPCSRV
jgi:hypothetical protein